MFGMRTGVPLLLNHQLKRFEMQKFLKLSMYDISPIAVRSPNYKSWAVDEVVGFEPTIAKRIDVSLLKARSVGSMPEDWSTAVLHKNHTPQPRTAIAFAYSFFCSLALRPENASTGKLPQTQNYV